MRFLLALLLYYLKMTSSFQMGSQRCKEVESILFDFGERLSDRATATFFFFFFIFVLQFNSQHNSLDSCGKISLVHYLRRASFLLENCTDTMSG